MTRYVPFAPSSKIRWRLTLPCRFTTLLVMLKLLFQQTRWQRVLRTKKGRVGVVPERRRCLSLPRRVQPHPGPSNQERLCLHHLPKLAASRGRQRVMSPPLATLLPQRSLRPLYRLFQVERWFLFRICTAHPTVESHIVHLAQFRSAS